jgi:hypothetical protein
MGSCYVAKASLELSDPRDSPDSVFQVTETTIVCHYIQLKNFFFNFKVKDQSGNNEGLLLWERFLKKNKTVKCNLIFLNEQINA